LSVYRSVLPVYRTGFAGFENRSGSGFLNPAHKSQQTITSHQQTDQG
jgi:hypothetical protein